MLLMRIESHFKDTLSRRVPSEQITYCLVMTDWLVGCWLKLIKIFALIIEISLPSSNRIVEVPQSEMKKIKLFAFRC